MSRPETAAAVKVVHAAKADPSKPSATSAEAENPEHAGAPDPSNDSVPVELAANGWSAASAVEET